jgi:hypothetical protein
MREQRTEIRREVDRAALETAREAIEGVNKLTYWMIGALFAGLVAVASATFSSQHAQIASMAALQTTQAGQIGALESTVKGADQRITALENRLTRIEGKIDLLLERKP